MQVQTPVNDVLNPKKKKAWNWKSSIPDDGIVEMARSAGYSFR